MRLILAVSLRRWRSLPKLFIQGLLLLLCSERNLSAKASEISALRGIPRSAARDLARRKMLSGISKVVFFIEPLSHIYGSMPSAPWIPRIPCGMAKFTQGLDGAVFLQKSSVFGISGGNKSDRKPRSDARDVHDVQNMHNVQRYGFG